MKKGMTLVELLVAMALSLILLSMFTTGVMMFNSTNDLTLNIARDNHYYQVLESFINDNKDKYISYDKSFKLDGDETNIVIPYDDVEIYYSCSNKYKNNDIYSDILNKYHVTKYEGDDDFLKCILSFNDNTITIIIYSFEIKETE